MLCMQYLLGGGFLFCFFFCLIVCLLGGFMFVLFLVLFSLFRFHAYKFVLFGVGFGGMLGVFR